MGREKGRGEELTIPQVNTIVNFTRIINFRPYPQLLTLCPQLLTLCWILSITFGSAQPRSARKPRQLHAITDISEMPPPPAKGTFSTQRVVHLMNHLGPFSSTNLQIWTKSTNFDIRFPLAEANSTLPDSKWLDLQAWIWSAPEGWRSPRHKRRGNGPLSLSEIERERPWCPESCVMNRPVVRSRAKREHFTRAFTRKTGNKYSPDCLTRRSRSKLNEFTDFHLKTRKQIYS